MAATDTKQPRPTPPKAEYNAGDEAHVAARQQQSKLADDARRDGLRFIMSDRRGRTWMRHLLAEKLFTRVGSRRPAAIFTGNSSTFYNAALKEVGDILSAELMSIAPEDFRQMETEGEA